MLLDLFSTDASAGESDEAIGPPLDHLQHQSLQTFQDELDCNNNNNNNCSDIHLLGSVIEAIVVPGSDEDQEEDEDAPSSSGSGLSLSAEEVDNDHEIDEVDEEILIMSSSSCGSGDDLPVDDEQPPNHRSIKIEYQGPLKLIYSLPTSSSTGGSNNVADALVVLERGQAEEKISSHSDNTTHSYSSLLLEEEEEENDDNHDGNGKYDDEADNDARDEENDQMPTNPLHFGKKLQTHEDLDLANGKCE